MKTEGSILVPPKRRPIWPFIIVGLLGAHVIGMAVAVTITERDKTFLVVPDYYDKAQHWDASQAEKRSSDGLGWKLKIEPRAAVDGDGAREMRFVLADAQGRAIPAISLQVSYFHHAHPAQQLKTTLTADVADGRVFPAKLPMPYVGVWEFHFIVHAGDKTFVQTQTEYVASQQELDAAAKKEAELP